MKNTHTPRTQYNTVIERSERQSDDAANWEVITAVDIPDLMRVSGLQLVSMQEESWSL